MTSVSVIVPVHDAGAYLAECLASLERQTLDGLEVICVDDASTDDSRAICDAFHEKDGRFKVVALSSNRGASAARNAGIDQASGEFIMFVDSDDWLPADDTVQRLYDAAVRSGAAIAGGEMTEYDVEADEIRVDYRNERHLRIYNFEESGLVDYRDWQGDLGFHRFIYSRELLVENGIRFPDLVRHEDPVFFVEAMIAAGRFYALAEPTYRYRINHKKVVLSEKALDDAVEAHARMLVLAEENDLSLLRYYVVESLRSYLVTQSPEVHEMTDRFYSSASFRIGNAILAPYHACIALAERVARSRRKLAGHADA